jgi:molybdopterin converting factor subunit 1
MQCRVKLFARARDLAGADEIAVALPESATVADLRRALASGYPVLAGLLERSALAVDNEFANNAQPVRPGVEIALLPPVSGG